MPIRLEPILVLFAVVASGGALVGMHFLARGERSDTSRFWSWAWATLLPAAAFAVWGGPGLEPWARLFAAPAPILLLAGSLAFVGRRVPRALLAAAPLAGLASAAGSLAGLAAPRAWAVAFGAVECLAAFVLARGRPPEGGWPERLLPVAMGLYALSHAGLVGAYPEQGLALPIVVAHVGSVLLLLTTQALALQERVHAEAGRTAAALRESEQRYRSLVENAGVVVICLDREHRVLEWNPTAEQVYGWSREEALGRDYFETFLPEEHREPIAREIDQILAGRPTVGYVNPVLRRDGTQRILRWDVTRLVDASGYAYGILCLAHDITEERRREEEQLRLFAAVEQAGDGIAIVDRERTIVYANPALGTMMERPLSELVGQPILALTFDWNDEQIVADIARTWSRGETWKHRYTTTWPDGRRFQRDATIAPVRDEAGQLAWAVAVVRDVTREVELEAHLLRSEKLTALGTLAGGIAHDFNNLLTAVIGGACELQEAQEKETRRTAEAIHEAAERGAALCRQLLAFGRRQPLRPETLEPGAVVRDMRGMLERLIGERVELVTRSDPEAWWVQADRSQIEQVVLNLVLNARDAMPGGGRVTVTTGGQHFGSEDAERPPELAPGEYVWLEVADTGEGMDAETRARALEPFFTRKAPGEGTGLGLATVYGIARQSGGDVRIESAPGRGTRVRVYLPRAEGAPLEKATPAPAARARGDETILLAEDDALVRRVAERTLAALGYRVLVAANGEEALARAGEAGGVDLLVSDVMMPGLCGGELARRLCARRPGTKVLFISGYAGEGSPDLSGATVLRKPFTPDQLAESVRLALG